MKYSAGLLIGTFLVTAFGCDGGQQVPPTQNVSNGDVGGTRVGDVVSRDLSSSALGANQTAQFEIAESGATFIKVHFENINLRQGDVLEVVDGNDRVQWRSSENGSGVWATSVDGDRALVRISAGEQEGARGVSVDKVGVGRISLDRFNEPAVQDGLGTSTQYSICGSDDKEPAACLSDSSSELFDQGKANVARSVGRLLFSSNGGMAVCTGTLVSAEGHFITNNHCISTDSAAEGLEVRFNYQDSTCSGTGSASVTTVNGSQLIKTSQQLDYALLLLDENVTDQFGYADISPEDLSVGDGIYIVQHPGGDPKEVAAVDSQTGGQCSVREVNASVPGYASNANVGYTCDTEGGSSGSPVFAENSNKIVALHHLGGCNNSGTYMRDIYPEIASYLGDDGGGNGGGGDGGNGGGGDPRITVLQNAQAVQSLSGSLGEWQLFKFTVPREARNLEVEMSGGTGDADLYVRYGEVPTLTQWDQRPYKGGNNESASVSIPDSGDWYIGVRGFASYQNMTLEASYSTRASGGSDASVLRDGSSVVLSGDKDSERFFTIDVPAGTSSLQIQTSGGTGDADLYVRRSEQPTKDVWDERPFRGGNEETVTIFSPAAASYHVMVRGWSSFSEVGLSASLN